MSIESSIEATDPASPPPGDAGAAEWRRLEQAESLELFCESWLRLQQIVPIELGPTGSIVAVTSSNALELTIGSF